MPTFLEEDLEILQAQARAWLEATLHAPLIEEVELKSLLADGEILAKVAQEVRRLQQKPDPSPRTPNHIKSRDIRKGKWFSSFSNVELFLSVCQELGVHDLDLFTPPDVVDERNVKRVCLCLRALSKKARAANLQIPDFDDHVTRLKFKSSGIIDAAKKGLHLHDPLPRQLKENSNNQPSKPATFVVQEGSLDQNSVPKLDLKTSNVSNSKREANLRSISQRKPEASELIKDPSPVLTSNENEEQKDNSSVRAVKQTANVFGIVTAAAFTAFTAAALCISFVNARKNHSSYNVKKGDTLTSIARSKGLKTWKPIQEKNDVIVNSDLIFPDQVLRI